MMEKANKDLRELIEERGLFYWMVGKHYGLSDGNFSRLLRNELSEDKKDQVKKAIEKATTEKNKKEGVK